MFDFSVSCTIWEHNEIKKAELSVFDISSAIISKVEMMPQSMDYFYVGIALATVLAVLPAIFRFCNTCTVDPSSNNNETSNIIAVSSPELVFSQIPEILQVVVEGAFGTALWYSQKNSNQTDLKQTFILGNALCF